jgi:tetratricopeptide (TPR) repeat protein
MHYSIGVNYLEQQKYQDAIDSFNTVLEKNPEYPKVYTLLGIAHYKKEMYAQAISELETAKRLQRSDKSARLYLGMAYLRYGNIDDAITEWNSYLEKFPYDNVSEQLRNGITVLESDETLPETVDLVTSSIEIIVAQEEKIRDMDYYYRHRGFGYGHRYPGFRSCD